MLELEEARARILTAIRPLVIERVPLAAAASRVLGEKLIAPIDLPPFDNSAMDGYAVRSADLRGASASSPVTLRQTAQVPAGAFSSQIIAPGCCVRLFTGSPLPPAADAVLMQEDTEPVDGACIRCRAEVEPGENIRCRGEDVRAGAVLGEVGEIVSAGALGLFAAVGLEAIAVHRQPRVALLATGSELVEAGQARLAGQIYESNRVALAPLVQAAGGLVHISQLVPDTADELHAALERAFAECDAVVTSGGVSVGEHDLVKQVFEQLGGHLDFWKVAIKPGRPFVFGQWRGRFLFGLPGNPVSALVTCGLLVYPALRQFQGASSLTLPAHPACLQETIENRNGRRHFMRVWVDSLGQVRSAGRQASHLLGSMARANALLDVPPRTIWPPGTSVSVLRLPGWT